MKTTYAVLAGCLLTTLNIVSTSTYANIAHADATNGLLKANFSTQSVATYQDMVLLQIPELQPTIIRPGRADSHVLVPSPEQGTIIEDEGMIESIEVASIPELKP